MSTEQYVGILISALEEISRRDPAGIHRHGIECVCRRWKGGLCMGCVAREALKAVPKETVNA